MAYGKYVCTQGQGEYYVIVFPELIRGQSSLWPVNIPAHREEEQRISLCAMMMLNVTHYVNYNTLPKIIILPLLSQKLGYLPIPLKSINDRAALLCTIVCMEQLQIHTCVYLNDTKHEKDDYGFNGYRREGNSSLLVVAKLVIDTVGV